MSRNDDDNNNNHEDKSRGRFHEDHFRHVHDHFFTHIFQHFHPFANFNHVGSNRQQPPLPPDVRFGVGGGGCGGESDDVLSSLHSIWSGDLHHVFANMDNLLKQFSFFDDGLSHVEHSCIFFRKMICKFLFLFFPSIESRSTDESTISPNN